ncbi:MAG: hypothetical protein ACXABG_05855 [Promethearchaeota archaeon]|jgi:hypothetical protein
MTIKVKSTPGNWTIEKLKELSHDDLMELYKSLPSAKFEEMNGEYDATMIKFPTERGKILGEWALYGTGSSHWIGKAFTPSSSIPEFRGEGYNTFRVGEKIVKHTRFASDMHESMIDGKLVFRMRYAHFKNFSGTADMIDEVRFLQEGLYLCVGTYNPDKLPPDFFCLSGPLKKYDHSPEWPYGNEIRRMSRAPFTLDNYPFPDELKKE